MEKEPTPEIMYIECDYCHEPVAVNDQTTAIQLYIEPAYSKYSFAAIKHETCEPMYKFVDVEDIYRLSYVQAVYVTDKPSPEHLKVLKDFYKNREMKPEQVMHGEPVIDVPSPEAVLKAFKKFIHAYGVEPYEFLTEQEYKRLV